MQNIYDILMFLRFVTDTNRGGYLEPSDASKALELGQIATFNRYWQTAYGSTQTTVEALKPFTFTTPPSTSTNSGIITPPSSLAHLLYILRTGDSKSFELVLSDELSDALESQLRPIIDFPRYTQDATSIQLYPSTITSVRIRYIKIPTSPIIAVTTIGGVETYDPTNSEQLGFDKNYWMEVIMEALKYIGASESNADVFALATQWQQQKGA